MQELGKTAPQPIKSIAGLAVAGASWAASQYVGASLWVPAVAALLIALLFAKTPLRPRYFKGAIAVVAAHVAWFAVALFMVGGLAIVADVVILGLALLWLWLRPGLPSVIALGLIELSLLVYNSVAYVAMPLGSAEHRAMTVHVALRVLALVTLFLGYRSMREEQSLATAPAAT